MSLVLAAVAIVMLALLVFLVVAMLRARQRVPEGRTTLEHAGPSPLVAWAGSHGVTVADPAPSTTVLPPELKPARLEPQRALRVLGDATRDGFTASTWEVRLSHLGGLSMYDQWHALTVPAAGPLPDLAVVAEPEIVHAEMCLPQRLAAGPVTKEGPVACFGAGPDVVARLAGAPGLLERIAATGAWVVTGPVTGPAGVTAGVSVTQQVEPDPQQLEERLAVARDVAAALG